MKTFFVSEHDDVNKAKKIITERIKIDEIFEDVARLLHVVDCNREEEMKIYLWDENKKNIATGIVAIEYIAHYSARIEEI